MKRKITYKKQKTREENAFPYLPLPLEQRLAASKSINITGNFSIREEGEYWSVTPKKTKDSEKK